MLQELPRVLPTIEAVRKALWTADIAGLIDADGWNNDEYDAYAPTLQSWLAEQLVLATFAFEVYNTIAVLILPEYCTAAFVAHRTRRASRTDDLWPVPHIP